ncbi:MAG: hypothetical protein WC533_00310 [Candidatus Pacearchaeota archaeon]
MKSRKTDRKKLEDRGYYFDNCPADGRGRVFSRHCNFPPKPIASFGKYPIRGLVIEYNIEDTEVLTAQACLKKVLDEEGIAYKERPSRKEVLPILRCKAEIYLALERRIRGKE